MEDFCKRLPKVELHAHINGSISTATMQQLLERKTQLDSDLATFKIPTSLRNIDDFFPLFKFIYRLTDDEEAVRLATRNVIDEFAADGVRYLELRTTPRQNVENGMTKESYLEAVLSVIEEPRNTIIVRLIVSIDRRSTLDDAEKVVDLGLRYRSRGIVGIDMCGDVKVGSFEKLQPAFVRAQKEGFKVTLHFNEVEENMVEASQLLAMHPNRLGHATLLDGPTRKEIYRQNIPIEVCMTSNILCKTVSTYEDHHVKDLLKEGHPFVICTDDKGVFFSNLSNEYNIAAKTFSMTYEQLYQSSYQSIDVIFESDGLKRQLKGEWDVWRKENEHYFN